MQQAEAYLTTRNEEETIHIGKILGYCLKDPLVIALQGELGVGKTVLVKGAARGLDIKEAVSSPTFVLLQIYQGRLPIYHFDFYRLENNEDPVELGFEDYLPGSGAAFIEWPERLPQLLPSQYLLIKIERFFDQRGEGRRIYFEPVGEPAAYLVDCLVESITWRLDGSLNC